jgi:hypothetical protein
MKRKSEQGSMQMQGEVQELAIEYYLESTFYRDDIEEVSKGKRGGDCVHVVKDDYNRVCGRILYESKRTKHFSHDWIGKDQRRHASATSRDGRDCNRCFTGRDDEIWRD